MSNPNIFLVPTCGNTFNNLGPYNSNLKSAFETKESGNLSSSSSNLPTTCSKCNKDLYSLGYTSDLYNCVKCMDLQKSTSTQPATSLATSWGCSNCYTVIAPIAYHENNKQGPSLITTPVDVTQEMVTKYLTNTDYSNSVNSDWSTATQLYKGDTVQKYCIEKQNFTMATPPPVDCKFTWGPWDSCNSVTKKQSRSPIISGLPANGGVECPSPEFQNCNDCEVNCTEYTECDPNTNQQTRTCTIIKQPTGFGVKQCSEIIESPKSCTVTGRSGSNTNSLPEYAIALIVVGAIVVLVLLGLFVRKIYKDWRYPREHGGVPPLSHKAKVKEFDNWINDLKIKFWSMFSWLRSHHKPVGILPDSPNQKLENAELRSNIRNIKFP